MKKCILSVFLSVALLFVLSACSFGSNHSGPQKQTYYPQYSVKDNVCIKNEAGEVLLNSTHFESVQVLETDKRPSVLLMFTDEGQDLFNQAVSENINKTLDLCVGDEVITSPKIMAETTGRSVTISTDTLKEAEDIVNKVKK